MSKISYICSKCGGANEYQSAHPYDVPIMPQMDDGSSSSLMLSLIDALALDGRVTICKHCLTTLVFASNLPACCEVVVKELQITLKVNDRGDHESQR